MTTKAAVSKSWRHGNVPVASVLTLHIRPDGSHQYEARVFDGRARVGPATLHASVEDAIQAYGKGNQHFPDATAFDVWYGGCSVGIIPVLEMRDAAPVLAERLRVLAAVLR